MSRPAPDAHDSPRGAAAQPSRDEVINKILIEIYGYHRQELRDSELLMWHRKLASFSLTSIGAAFDLHIDRSPYLPRFNEILSLIEPRSKALVFVDLELNVVRVGSYGTPVFAQPETAHVVECLGGWAKVCLEMPHPSDRVALEAYRKRVEALYEPASNLYQMRERERLIGAGSQYALETDRPHG